MATSRLTTLTLLWALTVASGSLSGQEVRPNFLFILTDDQSPETLSCYGATSCQTPNLDRLAREGMILHDAHHMGSWIGAVCLPSRTMIMTGRTVWRIPGASGPGLTQAAGLRKEAAQQSLPAIFNRAGYDTFRTCKNGNSFKEANALFTVSKTATSRSANPKRGSQWHGDQVMEYLESRELAEDKDPFLIYLGFSHPHDPRHATPELAAKYGAGNDGPLDPPSPKTPSLPLNYLPEHPFHHGHPGLRDEVKVQGVMTRRDVATVRNELGREYACIENIDQQVGRILDKLRATGELKNTYVIFTSDHGIAVGRHGLMGKQNLYEHTWRVPFIVRGPGIQAGSEASGYIYLLDLLPTLCDLAGIQTPEAVEGKSFRPVLEGKAERIRDVLYGVYAGGTKPGMRAIKTDGWKLIQYDVLDGEVQETQLFDLRNNPREYLKEHHARMVIEATGNRPSKLQINLADDPAYATKARQMKRLLETQMKELGDPYTLFQ
ncbi:MAG: sulfatase-like hydrolase/transferase [Planctomycetota bacterium]|nr:sulfatase-like hydrolase/transferase [Planctomycetota bacterium]